VKQTDLDILALLKAGDERGLERLFQQFYRPLVIYAQQYVGYVEAAEDIVQEVFIRFWESQPYQDINVNLRAYIYQSVRNSCLNQLKSSSKVQFGSIDEIGELSASEMLDESDWNEYMQEIYKKIELLPPRTREVFVAIVLENQKYKDVAEKMNISVNTVKTSLSRGLSTLRSNLSKEGKIILTLLTIV
jgi:RNA polymerase sigma-70 factor (ECF subfamily)